MRTLLHTPPGPASDCRPMPSGRRQRAARMVAAILGATTSATPKVVRVMAGHPARSARCAAFHARGPSARRRAAPALWGILLRPALAPTATQAAPPGAAELHRSSALAINPGVEIYLAQDGNIYRFNRDLGRSTAQAIYGRDFR